MSNMNSIPESLTDEEKSLIEIERAQRESERERQLAIEPALITSKAINSSVEKVTDSIYNFSSVLERQLENQSAIKEISLLQSDIIKCMELLRAQGIVIPDYKKLKRPKIKISEAELGLVDYCYEQIECIDTNVDMERYIRNSQKNPYERLVEYMRGEKMFYCDVAKDNGNVYVTKIYIPWVIYEDNGVIPEKIYRVKLPGRCRFDVDSTLRYVSIGNLVCILGSQYVYSQSKVFSEDNIYFCFSESHFENSVAKAVIYTEKPEKVLEFLITSQAKEYELIGGQAKKLKDAIESANRQVDISNLRNIHSKLLEALF